MIIFGMISALKISSLTLMTVLAVGMTISFTFADASIERPDAYAQWGTTSEFTTTGIAVAQVTDHYMNMNPKAIETLTVDVYTERNESSPELTITLTESDVDTGLFLAEIYFSETKTSSGNTLQVVNGDIVSVEYTYSQVPGSDKHEDKIGVGQEKTISNSPYVDSLFSGFGATVELDKEIYSWTDKVYITVRSPFHNLDSDRIDTIGNVPPYTIRMHTSSSDIDFYKLVETGSDTGVFTGEITLSGFTHDADGSGKYGASTENDTNPRTSGIGPTDGFLENSNDDAISVQFDYSEDVTIVGFAEIKWNLGKVQLLEHSYPTTGTAVVRITDPDMNWNPDKVDNFTIDVWSDSDASGINLPVTETDKATGIFEGTVYFTTTDDSSGHRLRVVEGDTITAEYEDNTLPNPYAPEDELDISDTAIIRNTTVPSPYKQMKNGVIAEHVVCNEPLEKIYKSNGHPACVNALSVEKLIQRGWSLQVPSNEK